jgi:hypothetical protein
MEHEQKRSIYFLSNYAWDLAGFFTAIEHYVIQRRVVTRVLYTFYFRSKSTYSSPVCAAFAPFTVSSPVSRSRGPVENGLIPFACEVTTVELYEVGGSIITTSLLEWQFLLCLYYFLTKFTYYLIVFDKNMAYLDINYNSINHIEDYLKHFQSASRNYLKKKLVSLWKKNSLRGPE